MILGYAVAGFESILVSVEVDIATTLPGLEIVGLPASEVKESRERVKTALRNSGFIWPNKKVLINLAPSDIKKRGAGLDLPIAVAILQATKQIPEFSEPTMVLGELQLNGVVRPVKNAVMAVLHAMKNNVVHYVLSVKNKKDISFSDARAISLTKLSELITSVDRDTKNYLWTDIKVQNKTGGLKQKDAQLYFPKDTMSLHQLSYCDKLKRAIQISAAGRHNLLLCGAPGTGKSAAATRMSTFIPKLNYEQALELSSIYANLGVKSESDTLENGLINRAPIRQPHHSTSVEAMVGSASSNTYNLGEVSLSHMGVLILDEAPEFKAKVLQALREPLDTQYIYVSRVGEKKKYPADFLLVLTCNLCPCGNLGKKQDILQKETNVVLESNYSTWNHANVCMCSEKEIFKYWKKIGGALWDRIEIKFTTSYRNCDEEEPLITRLQDIAYKQNQVCIALERQKHRFQKQHYKYNGRCADVSMFTISKEAQREITKQLKLGVSDRERLSLYKLSRSIADLENEDIISTTHVDEAMGFTKNII